MNTLSKIFFIPGNVPSLKNSKIKTSKGIFPSKTVNKYLRTIGIKNYSSKNKIVNQFVGKPNMFRESLKEFPKLELNDYPIILGFHFVRDSKRDFDFNNATQIIQDLLVAHNFIEDDSMRFLIPTYYKIEERYYTVDSKNPGVYLILKTNQHE